MIRTDPATFWPALLDRLATEFRQLDRTALARWRGDRARLVTYLAETHDLTRTEAAECLDWWWDRQERALRRARRAI
ncbi:hypothetical protein [Histidinibacterium aquaticum]|uniref:Uncharacterized protein n=1 Tax=Histidinibacterium aquaticum TaxID=2613962 RepID=A0A5J5GNK8_9RHOB|nr:hypothetical protein [Histidinibacterium aquaticum]KAA9009158.1 hypothetical protein F3S47_07845 [Histidinibacterium aquaticum]